MGSPLKGIKVLDLTRVLAGPYSTMILADFGADVIKIEIPEKGDDSRQFGPYINEQSAYFMSLNRNKRSMTLNLKTEKGKKLFLEMVKKADVVVENYRPGTMEKLGLDYNKLREINPKIIYAAASGFGHTGPYSKRPAYDAIVQAMGGLMSITGQENGSPTRMGASIGDIAAGLFTAIGILIALINRQSTGRGQKVDVAMLDCQIAILENAIARYMVSGEIPKPQGNRHPSIVPFEPFKTKDGEIMIAAGNDTLWQRLCQAIGREDLVYNKKFKSNALRNKNYGELKHILEDIIVTKKTDEWLKIFNDKGVPNGPINTIDKVIKDPQVLAREMIIDINHPLVGNLKVPGIPIKLSDTPGTIENFAPLLGEHTADILNEMLGYDNKTINSLKKEKIL